MRKLRAIWQILFADKWAVFTYEEAPNNPDWVIPPYFRWNLSDRDWYFLELVKKRLECLATAGENTRNSK